MGPAGMPAPSRLHGGFPDGAPPIGAACSNYDSPFNFLAFRTRRPLDSVAPGARPDGVNAATTGDHRLGDAGWAAVEAVRSLTMPASAPGLTVPVPFLSRAHPSGRPSLGRGSKFLRVGPWSGERHGAWRFRPLPVCDPSAQRWRGTCDFNSDTGAMCSRSGG